MDREELLFWSNRYDREARAYDSSIEKELGRKFRENGFVTKSDLKKIIRWKFQGRLSFRQSRFLRMLEDADETSIIETSRAALSSRNDETRLRLLSTIRCVGNALSSVILTFYDPQNYGVLDIHAWRSLFNEKEPSNLSTDVKSACLYFARLRDISSRTSLSCRDVEKALFTKDLYHNKSQ